MKMEPTMKTMETLRGELERLEAEAERREQRIANQEMDLDDCFVSRWSNRINKELVEKQIEIVQNDGRAEFPALYDLEGNLVCDRLVKTRYGLAFPVEREGGTEWVSFNLKPGTFKRKGYVLGKTMKLAWACIEGAGTGIGGMTSCYVKVFPR